MTKIKDPKAQKIIGIIERKLKEMTEELEKIEK